MRRAIGGVIAALPLALGVAVAHADQGPWGDGGQGSLGVPVIGTVVTVDGSGGSFTANAFVPTASTEPGDDNGDQGDQSPGSQGTSWGGSFGDDFARADFGGTSTTPATTLVTITTDLSTHIDVNGASGGVGDMKPGDHFVAFFNGSPTDPIGTLVMNPAVAIFDHTPPPQKQVYAFVGTVTGTDTTNGTVTLTVTASYPSGLAAASSSVTLTVSQDTLILGGTSSTGFGSTLANVSIGDVVAGGLIAPQGDTLTQVEGLPLQILLDLPVSSSSSSSTTTSNALKQALKLLGIKGASHSRKAHKSHKRSHHHSRHHSRKHAKKG